MGPEFHRNPEVYGGKMWSMMRQILELATQLDRAPDPELVLPIMRRQIAVAIETGAVDPEALE